MHLAHLSAAQSFDALRDAKRRGLPVSGETCPHYWVLTDEAVADYDTHAKMNPPLRSGGRSRRVHRRDRGRHDRLFRHRSRSPHVRREGAPVRGSAVRHRGTRDRAGLDPDVPRIAPGHVSLAGRSSCGQTRRGGCSTCRRWTWSPAPRPTSCCSTRKRVDRGTRPVLLLEGATRPSPAGISRAACSPP